MTPVIVIWRDAVQHEDGGVRPRHKPAVQTNIGWLLQYDDEGISFASEYSEEDGSWRGEYFIPADIIVSATELVLDD